MPENLCLFKINAKVVDNCCYTKDGKFKQSVGEAFVQNASFNSKLKVSFLPKIIRFLPVARSDYWVLKFDENYEPVLVDEPDKDICGSFLVHSSLNQNWYKNI